MISKIQFHLLKAIQRSGKYQRTEKNAKYIDFFYEMKYVTCEYDEKLKLYVYFITPQGENAIENYKHEHFQQNFNTFSSIAALVISLVALLI